MPLFSGALLFASGCTAPSADVPAAPATPTVRTTISPEAQSVLQKLLEKSGGPVSVPAPSDIEGWKILHDNAEAGRTQQSRSVIDQTGVTLSPLAMGGVPVLEVIPKNRKDDRNILVYLHGGAFTMFTAQSTAGNAALMAAETGLRTFSIDYTNPPAAQWETVQNQILAVMKTLVAEGHTMDRIAIYGDSAGGNLVVRTVLNLRDAGMGMPAAVVLFSPWADLTDSGDTATTLKTADPILSYDPLLAASARAYAGHVDLKDPRVSPLYADFTKGFPPTLIQEGTRTIFLSTSVRLYRVLVDSGADATIDMYEGMWHVFQTAPIPEAQTALRNAGRFVSARLK